MGINTEIDVEVTECQRTAFPVVTQFHEVRIITRGDDSPGGFLQRRFQHFFDVCQGFHGTGFDLVHKRIKGLPQGECFAQGIAETWQLLIQNLQGFHLRENSV